VKVMRALPSIRFIEWRRLEHFGERVEEREPGTRPARAYTEDEAL
jgi:hypothetical protein